MPKALPPFATTRITNGRTEAHQNPEAEQMRDHTNETLAILAGIGIGAALMFFLDPHRSNGNGRRVHANGDSAPTLHAVRDIEDVRTEADSDANTGEIPVVQMR
jgi:hypothetical protein